MNLAKIARKLVAMDTMDVGEAAGHRLAEGDDVAAAAAYVKGLLDELGDDGIDDEDEFDRGYWEGRWSLTDSDGMDRDEIAFVTKPWVAELSRLKAALGALGVGFSG